MDMQVLADRQELIDNNHLQTQDAVLKTCQIFWFGLVWFYGTSTIVGYLMPNPFLYL